MRHAPVVAIIARVLGSVLASTSKAKAESNAQAAPNHNPEFFVDESALVVGTRVMATLAVHFLRSESGGK